MILPPISEMPWNPQDEREIHASLDLNIDYFDSKDEDNALLQIRPSDLEKKHNFICSAYDFGSIEAVDYLDTIDSPSYFRNDTNVFRETSIKKIISFAHLMENWDGYGAAPPASDVIYNALQLIEGIDVGHVKLITDIYPNPHGTITIEWLDDGLNVFAELGKQSFNIYNRRVPSQMDFIAELPYSQVGYECIKDFLS